MNIRTQILFLFLSIILLFNCRPNLPDTDQANFQKYYDEFDVSGSFVVFNLKNELYTFHNKEQFDKPFTPASTFKICNSLIGLETGIIENENFIIHWDSLPRQYPKWNKDTDLKEAFQNSTVWYFQELATRVGSDTMKFWLDKLHYGNADTSGGVDKFWLYGGLRITPAQQIDFLRKLVQNNLPLSQRTMNIVKEIMTFEETSSYTLKAKTGWGVQDNQDIGWFVGYLESNNNTYIFANCVQTNNPNNENFAKARIEITYKIITDLGIITSADKK